MRIEPEDLSSYPGLAGAGHLWFENDGLKLHAVSAGQGPLLVLLHGFPEFWYCWRHQIAALSGHYRVLAPDLRGFYLSQPPDTQAGYAMPAVAGDVLELIRAVGEQQAVLIAHDWGGYVGWHAARRNARCVRGLITLSVPSPNSMGKALREQPEQQAASAYVAALAEEQAHSQIDPAQLFRHLPLDSQDLERYQQAYARSGLRGPLGYYRLGASAGDRSLIDLPGPIDSPVLAIHGDQDSYVTQGSYIDDDRMTRSDYRFRLIEGAGHFLPRERPDRVNRLILEQLAQWNY